MVGDRPDGRRHDLDALRVCCFGTLIIYHSSFVYGAKTWWVHASDTTKLIDLITIGSHPWRMSLLFFISGVVTASLLKNRSVAEIRTTRTRQLLLPFVFGVFVVVPPQIYFSPYNFTPDLSYWEFWKTYVVSGIQLEHMWFLAYLWIYVVAWSIAQPQLARRWPGLSASLAAQLRGRVLFVAPIAFLSILRLCLYPVFRETLVISSDVYSHAVYFSMFMLGTLLANEQSFWQEVDRQRWISLGVATLSLAVLAALSVFIPREARPEALVLAVRVIRSVFQWSAVLVLLAFAGRLASRPNRVIMHLNKSIMTYYIAHQTVIVIAAYYIAKAGLLDIRSFIPLVVITALVCALIAETKRLATARLVPFLAGIVAMRKGLRKPLPPGTSLSDFQIDLPVTALASGAGGGDRTRTAKGREILSLLRLPVSPRPRRLLIQRLRRFSQGHACAGQTSGRIRLGGANPVEQRSDSDANRGAQGFHGRVVKTGVAGGRQILQIFDEHRTRDQQDGHHEPVPGISHGKGEADHQIGERPVDVD